MNDCKESTVQGFDVNASGLKVKEETLMLILKQ